MRPIYEIIRRPVVTEKSFAGKADSRYTFEVALDATKAAIRESVENFFKVKVTSVRTIKVPGKSRRYGRHQGKSAPWKKAIVTLEAGQKIEMLEVE